MFCSSADLSVIHNLGLLDFPIWIDEARRSRTACGSAGDGSVIRSEKDEVAKPVAKAVTRLEESIRLEEKNS